MCWLLYVTRTRDRFTCVLAGDLHTGTQAIGDQALHEALEYGPALLAVDLDAVGCSPPTA
ncbi:hypothetical protein ACFWG0_26915 [Streptomyces yangpuensis]|uniref:hypothetical protein n=1 Tax=Streptomyces yangpuensis TaxID=1648182 RepID=UPI003666E58F